MDGILPGFRFFPTEEELISFYLHNKLLGSRPELNSVIPVVNIYDHDPSDLPKLAGELCPRDIDEWFFFVPRQEREARGGRPNRLTSRGYWKATGSSSVVYSRQNRAIGKKRTMVFYVGRAPHGRKTEWKVNEYKVVESEDGASSSTGPKPQLLGEFSLCRIYKRSKCIRTTFDRRPSTKVERGDDQLLVHLHHHDHYHNETPALMQAVKIDSSLESSSTRFSNRNNAAAAQSTMGNEDSIAEDEPIWDWKIFDLFN